MKKRLISLALVLVMLLVTIPTAAAANPGFKNFKKVNTYEAGQFTDVPTNVWYAANVQKAYEFGLVKGTSETGFNPDGNITVAEMLALACRLNSIYNGKGSDFQQGDPWYQVYADYAEENGLLTNVSFQNYTDTATREQFAIIFASSLPDKALSAINKIEDGQVPDVSSSTPGGKAVYKLYNAGILTGADSSGTFHPNNNISRAEVATMAIRMADKEMRFTFELTAPEASTPKYSEAEQVDLAVFTATFRECHTTINKLYDLWQNDLAQNIPSPVYKFDQAVDYLIELEAKFTVLIEEFSHYGYYDELLNEMQDQIDYIDEVLERPVSSKASDQFMFLATGIPCMSSVTGLPALALMGTDFLVALGNEMFG